MCYNVTTQSYTIIADHPSPDCPPTNTQAFKKRFSPQERSRLNLILRNHVGRMEGLVCHTIMLCRMQPIICFFSSTRALVNNDRKTHRFLDWTSVLGSNSSSCTCSRTAQTNHASCQHDFPKSAWERNGPHWTPLLLSAYLPKSAHLSALLDFPKP